LGFIKYLKVDDQPVSVLTGHICIFSISLATWQQKNKSEASTVAMSLEGILVENITNQSAWQQY